MSLPEAITAKSILIVEDNFLIAEGLALSLRELGFQKIETARSLEQGLEFVERATPGLALLDVNLGDGKTTQPIAEILVDRDIPVLFTTGYEELKDLPSKLKDLPVVAKPADAASIGRAILSIFE